MAIFITDIKILHGDRNLIERHFIPGQSSVRLLIDDKDGYLKTVEISREQIQGRSFRNRYNEDVVIGLSKEVQEALGLPMEAFDSMSQTISDQRNTIWDLKSKLVNVNQMTLWQRIKFVFKGSNSSHITTYQMK